MILRLLYISVLFSLCVQAHAQTFPIQGNVMLSPPYSPYLTDLTAPGAQRLTLQLRVNDPTLSDYTCKLRLTIEGVGITLRTKASFFPQVLNLQGGGIPQIFYGEDLMEYFNPANLDFAGITRSAFDKTKRLPEGVYRFTFEVLDYNRGTVVSSKITTTAWIILNDPPLLNLPRLNTKISILDPVNIPFTWTPRHSASPNAAFTTEYIFRLVELPPGDYRNASAAQTAANQAILSQVPLLETVLTQSQLVYGISEPALLPGRFYAWQVEARDTEGRDLFKNNGKSEVFVFQFGDALGTPLNLHSQGSTASAISLRWEVPSSGDMPEQYRISYQYNDKWYEAVTSNRWFTIGNLQADTRYPIKVRSEKGKQYSEYSASITLNTLDASSAFQCGQKGNDQPQQVPGTPLFRLLPGDKLSLGKFTILVTEASGTNGYFNGVGYMSIPAFNGAGIKVKFHGKVDQFYVLDGEAESIMTEGGWAANAIDVMEKIGEDRRKLEEQYQKEADIPVQLIIIGEIAAVVITPAGDIEIEKTDGTKETIKHPLDEKTKEKETVVLTDEKGNSYKVQKDETTGETKVSKVEGGGGLNPGGTLDITQLDDFEKKVLEILKEYLQGIKDYHSAQQQGNPSKGGGPSFFDWEWEEIILVGLPSCFEPYKNKLTDIENKIVDYTSSTEKIKEFVKAIKEKVASTSNDEEVRYAMCEALTGDVSGNVASGLMALIGSDTLKAINQVFIITGQSFKFDTKYNVTNGGEVSFKLTIKPEGGGSEIKHPSSDWKKVRNNENWVLDFSSVQEGLYMLSYKVGTTTTNLDFYVRTAAHDYACSVCGRNLKLTQTDLDNIFPDSKVKNDPSVLTYFNEALKKGDFTTCHRQAHFFSQVYEESGGMKASIEGSGYPVKRMLEIYKGNSNVKTVFFKQDFWDKKDYLNYASVNLYETSVDTTITKYEGKNYQTFKWNSTTSSDTVKIPTEFTQKKDAEYKKVTLTETQIASNGKNLFNLVYANKNGNGNVASGDGYKFRGRGAIQLTGRATYREVANKCNSLFGTAFSWESNPDVLKDDNKAIVYSVAGFFLWKFGDLKNLDTKDVTYVTKKVNGSTTGLNTRTSKFNEYLIGRLNNCKIEK